MKVKFDPEVVADSARIGLRYRALNAQATLNIRADIRATIYRVASNPLSYALIGQEDIRRAVTRVCTYLVYFRIEDDESIIVLCVRRGAQRPRFPASGD
ncbi:MAG: type II toxin-antitoxin system RelE/ParE family toxin [Janthinobacterium lividum]